MRVLFALRGGGARGITKQALARWRAASASSSPCVCSRGVLQPCASGGDGLGRSNCTPPPRVPPRSGVPDCRVTSWDDRSRHNFVSWSIPMRPMSPAGSASIHAGAHSAHRLCVHVRACARYVRACVLQRKPCAGYGAEGNPICPTQYSIHSVLHAPLATTSHPTMTLRR